MEHLANYSHDLLTQVINSASKNLGHGPKPPQYLHHSYASDTTGEMENRKYSDYYNQLEDIVKARYCDKLDLIGAGVTVLINSADEGEMILCEDELCLIHTSCLS